MLLNHPNFAKVFGKRRVNKPVTPGRQVIAATGSPQVARKHDSKRFRSFSSGCAPSQVPDFTKRFGHLGVTFDPRTGDAIYRDRQSKLAVLKARGMVDFQEVRG